MLLLSSQQQQQQQKPQKQQPILASSSCTKPSSSPSFWISKIVGALLVCPPDLIERWIPMAAPFPKTIQENARRRIIDRILEEVWDDSNSSDDIIGNGPNRTPGYDIQGIDEWIVDNQRQNRNEGELENSGDGETTEEKSKDFRSRILSSGIDTQGASGSSTTSTIAAKSADSLFSNYFLSLHLLFSLPSIGQNNDGILPANTIDSKSSTTTMKPSTYGEITPLGARQLFGAMGLLDRISTTIAGCNMDNDSLSSEEIHFVDLGSGTGKLIGQAVLELSPRMLKQATGVELSPSRHDSAMRAKQALLQWLQQKKQQGKSKSTTESRAIDSCGIDEIDKRLELIEGDLFDIDLSTVTHIYVASLCFPDNLMLRLEEKLRDRIACQRNNQYFQGQYCNDDNASTKTNDATRTGATGPSEGVAAAKLQWVATLRKFPNDLGGIQPGIRFMEMSWTSPLGCAVYLYRCN